MASSSGLSIEEKQSWAKIAQDNEVAGTTIPLTEIVTSGNNNLIQQEGENKGVSWADIVAGESDEEIPEISNPDFEGLNEGDYKEDEIESEGDVGLTYKEGIIHSIEDKKCNCFEFKEIGNIVHYLGEILSDSFSIGVNHDCVIDNIIRVCNYFMENYVDMDSCERLYFCDMFYRVRHEILFKCLCLILNLPQFKSDTKFSDFGINSERTPDYIFKNEEVLYIIEVSATSNFERSAVSKGLEEAGFESKYKDEMDMLSDKGEKVVYIPFLFDMSNYGNNEYIKGFSKLPNNIKINQSYKSILKSVKESFCNISLTLKNYLGVPSQILFTRNEYVNIDHEEIDFMVDNKTIDKNNGRNYKYLELCISPQIYNKVTNNWYRLSDMMGKFPENEKVTFVIDTSSHRLWCSNVSGKCTVKQLETMISRNDKNSIFDNTLIKIGGEFKPCTESNDGVRYIETSKIETERETQKISLISNHSKVDYIQVKHDFNKSFYYGKIQNYFKINYSFSEDYPEFESDFISKILENDKENNEPNKEEYFIKDNVLMGNQSLEKIDIDDIFDSMKEVAIKNNSFEERLPLKIQKNKSPFILPVAEITPASYCKINHKNERFLNILKNEISITDPYTCLVINEVLKGEFEFVKNAVLPSSDYMEIKKEKYRISSEITRVHRSYCKKNNVVKIRFKDMEDCEERREYEDLSRSLSQIQKRMNERLKIENIKNETQLVRLPTKNKGSYLNEKFLIEMSHFKDKKIQSTIEGVGYRMGLDSDYKLDLEVFNNICSWLSSRSGDNPNLFFQDESSDDCKLLKELKSLAVKEYENLIEEIKSSFLGHSAAFVSNFAHSLLYYSQQPFNSDYIRVDNLGYKDVLLIVRGGKKIFKSKASKMYRLLFPINNCLIPWIKSNNGAECSTKILSIDGKKYLLTPWSVLHESILNDSISFYTRVLSFNILNLNPKVKFQMQFGRTSFNTLLSYHNKRQTEVMLANLRYILLATLGDFTGITQIFEEFMGFNYDCFQSYIRGCLIFNYPDYFKKLMKLKNEKKVTNFQKYIEKDPTNLFSGFKISCEEDLALMIYSTFLMTKAPYQRPAERSRNLKGIMEIHRYFDETIGLDSDLQQFYEKTSVKIQNYNSLSEYTSELFKNDFNFDPGYCSQIGKFADSYYNNRNLKEEIFISWNNILNKSWDELATSTGLRGKMDDLSNFWGQKGYFVVYRDLIKNAQFMRQMSDLFSMEIDSDKKRKLLRDLSITYKAKIGECKEYLLFHAVDKVQWRGGREIYVMDMETKTVQQPIENFMGYLCKNIDNELISIPSDRRAQVIHHSIFEKDLPMKDTLTWYLTLDCSKWAPKSNYLKFICMILSMSVLPPGFKTHFLNYSVKLFKKRIYFNEAEVIVLKNNPTYTPIVEKYLNEDKEKKAYYLLMPYSWVMGIFNYTSSFMHSFNQKYAEYIIFKTSLISYNEETSLKMFAHSDDSGGRNTCKSKFFMSRCLILYELNLKACNHLLSKKKSVVSRFYFEILSVIYIFKKLLALLPKFLGGLRFTPTDKGPAQDMLASYSKCNEVMVAGACFNVAYLVMKFYSFMVYRFYNHNRPVSKELYDRPVQYLGLPDAHPLMVLLCGADSDIVRLLSAGKRNLLSLQHCVVKDVMETIEDEGPIKPIKFNVNVRGIKKGFEEVSEMYEDIIRTWSVSNVNFHSTPFNLLSFLSKLQDPGFVGSLVNESTTRRLSRAYHMRKGECINSSKGFKTKDEFNSYFKSLCFENENNLLTIIPKEDLDKIRNEIKTKIPFSLKQIEVLEMALSSPLRICRYMDELSVVNKQIVISNRTLKPSHIELIKSPKTFTTIFDPAQMVSYIKEPELSWALPNIRNLYTARIEVENMCVDNGFDIKTMDPSTLLKLCRNYSNKHSKNIYLYSQIPGEIRNIKTYSAFLTFLSTNTFTNKEIKGLTLSLKNNLTDPGYVSVNIDEDIYMISSIISIINVFVNSIGSEDILFYRINPIKFLDWNGGNLKDFITFLKKMSNKYDMTHFFIPLSYLNDTLLSKFSGKCSAEFIKQGSYYYFSKPQKSKEGWYGKGEIMICIKDRVYKFTLYNTFAIELETTEFGKMNKDDVSFILDVLVKSNIQIDKPKKRSRVINYKDLFFGVDNNGDYSVAGRANIEFGIPAIFNPAIYCLSREYYFEIRNISKNTFLLEKEGIERQKRQKIYTLPLIQGDIYNLIKIMFNKDDFESKLLQVGINDFEEYVMTEIMTEFGFETYINPFDFFDGYNSSEIFKILKETRNEEYSKIPSKITCGKTNLPAPEGSLIRILIDYTNKTDNKIVNTFKNLTPEIMALRSNFPENVSLILSENLIECHKNIYNNSEQMEIKRAYELLSTSDDLESFQLNAIKLMSHWGYGSLVNTIENYTLSKSNKNYFYFSMKDISSVKSALSSNLFKSLLNSILISMSKHLDIIDSIELPMPNLFMRHNDFIKFTNELLTSIVNNLYCGQINFSHEDINILIFHNFLIGFMKDDDFMDTLRIEMDKDPILCSLEISFQKRKLFLSLFNTLYYNYVNLKKVNHPLDFTKKVEKIPIDVVSPFVLFKDLNNIKDDLNIKKYNPQYHNFLNDSIMSYINESYHLDVDGVEYRIQNKIKKRSNFKIPMSEFIRQDLMYNEEIEDNDDWQEVLATFEMGDPEEEDISEYYDLIPNKFIKPKTSFLKNSKRKIMMLTLTWVIDPFVSNLHDVEGYYRQCGENIVVVSTSYLPRFMKYFPNTNCFRVNWTKTLKRDCPEMLIHTTGSSLINEKLWHKMIGGSVFKLPANYDDEMILDSYIKDKEKIGGIYDLGVTFDEMYQEYMESKDKEEDIDNVAIEVDDKDKERSTIIDESETKMEEQVKDKENEISGGESPEEEEENNFDIIYNQVCNEKERISKLNKEQYIKEVEQMIDKAHKMKLIKNKMKWRLIDKYAKSDLEKVIPIEDLLLNCMNEIMLEKISKNIVSGEFKLSTKEEYVKVFLSPSHFGMAQGYSRGKGGTIKNKKVLAEMNSIYPNLGQKISSGTLEVSINFIRTLQSNYKLWSRAILHTDYKSESKKFVLLLFLLIVNCSMVVSDDTDNSMWQDIINLFTNYIADEGPDSDEDEISELMINFNISSDSRLKYKISGL